jgi:hypothetical protein
MGQDINSRKKSFEKAREEFTGKRFTIDKLSEEAYGNLAMAAIGRTSFFLPFYNSASGPALS